MKSGVLTRNQAISWPFVRQLGRLVAYAIIPVTLARGDAFAPQDPFFFLIYLLAAVGIVAVLRGVDVPKLLMSFGYFLLAWYCILLLIEMVNGDLTRTPRPLGSNFLTTYFVLLAFPFFAIGLREVGVDLKKLELTMAVTILAAAAWSLFQFFFLDVVRPGGFNGLNPIQFGMFALVWSLFLFSSALKSDKIDPFRMAVALVGLVPVLLSGSKLVWACAALGCSILFIWWGWTWRRWPALGVATAAAAVLAVLAYQAEVVRLRIVSMMNELTAFITTGDTTGLSFGLRFAAAKSGLIAFFDRPFTGYGLTDVKLAAVAHRPADVADIISLWHLHNEYITHMVAFGILGLIFLLSLVAAFLYLARRSDDVTAKRFGVVVFAIFPVYMIAESAFGRSPVYGLMFFVCGLMFLTSASTSPYGIQSSGFRRARRPLPGSYRVVHQPQTRRGTRP